MTADSARGCTIESFVIVDGLNEDQKATGGQKVTFKVGFEDSTSRTASARIDYGDGTAEDGAPRTLQGTFGVPGASLHFDHVYTRPGAFSAVLKGGSIGTEACGFSGWFGFGLAVGGKPAIHVTVVDNPSKSRVRRAATPPQLAPQFAAEKKSSLAVVPTATPAAKASGAIQTVGKEKTTAAFAFAPGQIAHGSVSQSPLGAVLNVEGSGKCGLKVFEELSGKALHTYDFSGPLPTSIRMLNFLPGMHVVKIEGDKSSQSCGGTASASFPIARSGAAF